MRGWIGAFFGFLLLAAFASAQAQSDDGFGFSINADNTITITGYSGPGGDVTIPGSINGLRVTIIGWNAFEYGTSLTGVTIPDSVTTVDGFAFEGCSSLTSVNIPTNVSSLGINSFEFCTSLTNVTIPGSVNSIGGYAFYGCQELNGIAIANGVASIGTYAFYDCTNLTSLSIPGTVESIGDLAFYLCGNLTNVTMAYGVTGLGSELFLNCGNLVSATIPGTVTTLGDYLFGSCSSLSSVTIGNGVTTIMDRAFYGCLSLRSIMIPASVSSIQINAFQECPTLTSVYFWGNAPATDPTALDSDTGATVYYLAGTTGWSSPFAGLPAVLWNPLLAGALQVSISPTAAITAGAQWDVDSGTFQGSGAIVTNLSVGVHTVSFSTISGWMTPDNQTVTVTNGVITTATGLYVPSTTPSNGLILLTNGYGIIRHGAWTERLVIGKKYIVTAVPDRRNLFSYWLAGTNEPYAVLSLSDKYTFTMQSNLLLEANFVTNLFLSAHGTYRGLFAPTNSARQQTNSGSFLCTVDRNGVVSGALDLGGQVVRLLGEFNPSGAATIVSKRSHDEPALTTTLQLAFADQSVSGIVSDGDFTAELNGDREVFNASNQSTNFEDRYTLIIPGANDPDVGPYGVSYGTVSVNSLGTITLAGSLADGSQISQSSALSKDGFWPLYVELYHGKGSLWGWNYLTNHTINNASALSWINATNSSKTTAYRSGFTNQNATLTGEIYVSTIKLPADLTAYLEGGNLPFAITNGVTLSANNKITLTNLLDETNKLTLTVNQRTGVITGSFANPAKPKQAIKVNAVILQDQTNAQGYFLGTNQSGVLILDPQ